MGSIRASVCAAEPGSRLPACAEAIVASPLGPLAVRVSASGLCAVDFCPPHTSIASPNASGPLADRLQDVAARLARYFTGDIQAFEGLALDEGEATPFQRAVWQALRAIPYGQIRSYRDIARHVGRPKGAQAVGQANRRNPMPIVTPCHRVIAANGTLGGYQGRDGLAIKQALLAHEGVARPQRP